MQGGSKNDCGIGQKLGLNQKPSPLLLSLVDVNFSEALTALPGWHITGLLCLLAKRPQQARLGPRRPVMCCFTGTVHISDWFPNPSLRGTLPRDCLSAQQSAS